MRVNLKLALATLLSAALGSSAIGYGQQYYATTDSSPTATAVSTETYTSAAVAECQQCQADCACACEEEVATCDPWRLFPEFGGWQLYGYLNASAVANADAPATHFNGPVTFLDKEAVRLNQAYFTLEKVADNGGCGVAFGGRVDLMYGTDYVFTQAAGLELRQNGTPHWNQGNAPLAQREYGLALPQLYGEMAYNDVSMKVGHFYAIMGYQVVPAIGNFFITQPYTFQYGEPFTHTGAIASWKYSDTVTLHGAVVNGWDKVDAVTDRPSVMGGFTYAPAHEKYTIYNTTMLGEEDGALSPANGTMLGYRFLNAFVFTYNMTEKTQYVFQSDYGFQENAALPAPTGRAEWYGANQYLFYTVNDCWKLGGRFEWFRDNSGYRLVSAPQRVGGILGGTLPVPAGLAQHNFAGDYFQIALGANWKPTSNLIIRPELRWDWSANTDVAPFNDLTKDSQFLAAVDAIVQF